MAASAPAFVADATAAATQPLEFVFIDLDDFVSLKYVANNCTFYTALAARHCFVVLLLDTLNSSGASCRGC